jgi:hypothetical protein
VSAGPFDFVGGKKKARNENGVGVGVYEGPEIGISAKLCVRVGTAVIATPGSCGRLIAVGTNSETICNARTAAVLFILANERSAVLRILMSMAVGGFGLNPDIKTIIQTMLAQRNKAANACNGTR